jgi:6-phosphogluconolactonase
MTDNNILIYMTSSKSNHDTGVYVCELDTGTGALRQVDAIMAIHPCHYLAFHPQRRFVYVTGVNSGDIEADPGVVSAFALDPHTGKTTYLNRQPTGGISPCYVSVDGAGRFVLVANYSGNDKVGSISVLPILEEGQVGAATDRRRHEGGSTNPTRQKESHTHMVASDPANRQVFVTDLGTDKVMLYRLDSASGKLIAHDPPFASIAAGSGPRHFAFSERQVYVINELANTLTVFDYDAERGVLSERQTISTLPDDYSDPSYAADVHLSPSGRFLYASNRGHNSIAIFAVAHETGELTPIGYESTQGNFPRSFTLDPTGAFLIVANQLSDTVVTFHVDTATGKLTPTGHTFAAPACGCVKALMLEG